MKNGGLFRTVAVYEVTDGLNAGDRANLLNLKSSSTSVAIDASDEAALFTMTL